MKKNVSEVFLLLALFQIVSAVVCDLNFFLAISCLKNDFKYIPCANRAIQLLNIVVVF